jgi:hypothetical protein
VESPRRGQVETRETLQEGRRTAFRDPRFAVHDEILSEAQRVRAAAEAREHGIMAACSKPSSDILGIGGRLGASGQPIVAIELEPGGRRMSMLR